MKPSPSAPTTPEPARQLARPKIHALTSTRFFAALYVVLYHSRWGIAPGSTLDRFLSLGFVSVGFFFLLSGYILAVVYLRTGKSVAPRSFYVARFARIYPLYIVSVMLDAPFAVAARVAQYGLMAALVRVGALFTASVFMMQMFVPNLTVINIPSWSLAIETVFYLSFPLIGLWLWKLEKKRVVPMALLLYAGGVGMNWLLTHWWPHYLDGMNLPAQLTTFSLGILLDFLPPLGEGLDLGAVLLAGGTFLLSIRKHHLEQAREKTRWLFEGGQEPPPPPEPPIIEIPKINENPKS